MGADVGVLGGGITGLALGRFLGGGAEVLEAADRPGGLLRTFGRNGFWSDVGGHILFSKDDAVLGAMVGALGDNVAQRRRNNKVLYEGVLVKYPFENGLGALPKEVIYDCLLSFVKNDAPPPPHKNFHEWMVFTLGRGITERYLLPYNRKIWKREPAEMGIEWVERVPRPPIEDVLKSALGIETEGYTHQLHFFYPREGGIEALARAFAEPLAREGRLVTGCRVERIRRTDAGWIVNDEREYRELCSTLPADALLAALGDVPAEVREAAGGLRCNALAVVMLGVQRREGLDDMTAIYVPDPAACFHRVCFNNAFSPWMAPEGAASIQCEITGNAGDGVLDMDDDALCERVHRELCAIGVLRPDDAVVERMVHRERLAYVVPELGAAARARTVTGYLASRGIHAAGRFAEHSYLNMDGCVRRAMDVARALRGVAP
jgi:protoporphyrinogen oxidase